MKGTGKRGRPKRKISSNEESNSEFSKKLKRNVSKKNIQGKPKSLNKKSKSRYELDSSSDDFSDSEMENQNGKKLVKIPVQPFNPNKIYAQILNKANKEPQFLILIKNLLSGYSQTLQDKKNHIKKKWNQLRNSNCTQDQYHARESELRRMEIEEIKEIKEDIISKLSFANIKGLKTRVSLVNDYKQVNPIEDQSKEYFIQDSVWDKYHEQQLNVLEMLMKENDFVSKYHEVPTMIQSKPSEQPQLIENKQEKEIENKFLEETNEATQFLFCKHYNSINFDKVFDSANPFKLAEQEKYYIDSRAMGWLLESKCDEIYTNQKFQKETFLKYSEVLKKIYLRPSQFTESQIISSILQVSAYVLNSVHYYQKFKLKCELLHPLDILLVIQKLLRGNPEKQELRERMEAIVMDIEDEDKMIPQIQEHSY